MTTTRFIDGGEKLRQRVVDDGGLAWIRNQELLTFCNAGSLGCHVRPEISGWMRSAGVLHFPEELEPGNHWVLLVAEGTDAGDQARVAFRLAAIDQAEPEQP